MSTGWVRALFMTGVGLGSESIKHTVPHPLIGVLLQPWFARSQFSRMPTGYAPLVQVPLLIYRP
jgi:hypothetical protein